MPSCLVQQCYLMCQRAAQLETTQDTPWGGSMAQSPSWIKHSPRLPVLHPEHGGRGSGRVSRVRLNSPASFQPGHPAQWAEPCLISKSLRVCVEWGEWQGAVFMVLRGSNSLNCRKYRKKTLGTISDFRKHALGTSMHQGPSLGCSSYPPDLAITSISHPVFRPHVLLLFMP